MKRPGMPPRKTRLRSRSPIKQGGTPIKKVNPERKAKRAKKFKAYLSSAAWKNLRLARFRVDGWRCTAVVPLCIGEFMRCPNWDETGSGKGLICDHLTYARFGHENLDDLRTLCRSCNARETTGKRANWMRQ